MTENGVFELAVEIASKIAGACESTTDSQEIMRLTKELLEIRWSISLKPSS